MSLSEKSFLWTWDTRMNWTKEEFEIPKKMASCDQIMPYFGNKELFLDNYKRLIDFMGQVNIPHLIIWGLLRDNHGGVDAAIKLCEYAHDHNVKIISGIGTQGYGGVFYEGQHEFNALCWIDQHPELAENTVLIKHNSIIELRGKALCPSKQQNIEWLNRGIDWLIKTIPIDGINLENGDYINCPCKECNRRRSEVNDIYDIYFRSLSLSYQPIIDFVIENHPHIYVVNSLYTGFHQKFIDDHAGLFSLSKHDNTCNSWTLTQMSKETDWDKGIVFPNDHNQAYFHYFSTANNSQQTFFGKQIHNNFQKLSKLNFNGAGIYGEESADSIIGLANYLFFAECIKDCNVDYHYLLNELLPNKCKEHDLDQEFDPENLNNRAK